MVNNNQNNKKKSSNKTLIIVISSLCVTAVIGLTVAILLLSKKTTGPSEEDIKMAKNISTNIITSVNDLLVKDQKDYSLKSITTLNYNADSKSLSFCSLTSKDQYVNVELSLDVDTFNFETILKGLKENDKTPLSNIANYKFMEYFGEKIEKVYFSNENYFLWVHYSYYKNASDKYVAYSSGIYMINGEINILHSFTATDVSVNNFVINENSGHFNSINMDKEPTYYTFVRTIHGIG